MGLAPCVIPQLFIQKHPLTDATKHVVMFKALIYDDLMVIVMAMALSTFFWSLKNKC